MHFSKLASILSTSLLLHTTLSAPVETIKMGISADEPFLLSAYTDTNYDGTGYDLQGDYAQCYNIPAFLQNDIKSLQLDEGTKKCVLYEEKACAGKKKTFSKDSKVTFKPVASLYCYADSDSSAASSNDGSVE